MNEKLKKIRDEAFRNHADTITGIMLKREFDAGFEAAIPHIRRDERERVLKHFNNPEFAVHKAWLEWLENGLKKMDEAHDAK